MHYRHEEDDRLTNRPLHHPGPRDNRWLLPIGATGGGGAVGDAVFTRQIVARHEPKHHNQAASGEILVPPPAGASPRRTVRRYMTILGVRKYIQFFIGCGTALPAAFGWVEERAPITAAEFAEQVRAGGVEELAEFSAREAWFILNAAAALQVGAPVFVSIAERMGNGTKRKELTIRRLPIALTR